MTNIYGLYDPRRPHVIMYVGKGMEGRARHHWKLFLAKGVTTNALLRAWFEKLRAAHIEPRWRFIEEGVPDAQWGNRERYWIAWWKERNPGLCNVAPGGNAWPPGRVHDWAVSSVVARAVAPVPSGQISIPRRPARLVAKAVASAVAKAVAPAPSGRRSITSRPVQTVARPDSSVPTTVGTSRETG